MSHLLNMGVETIYVNGVWINFTLSTKIEMGSLNGIHM